jgi:dTDP-4-dehydrorhamnose reductase
MCVKKIFVTGKNGQLGSELALLAKQHQEFHWFFSDRSTCDLADLNQVTRTLNEILPDIIINCAAYTAVDKAENELDVADKINHQVVACIAKWSSANNSKLIHVSTDYVFDGTASFPLDENAATAPINVYGQTKLAGEIACLHEAPASIIIRTSWVYSHFGNNFVKTMMRLMSEKESLNIVEDQIGSPTYAADLAQAILHILNAKDWHPGIYHYSNEGQLSWYQFAKDIKAILNLNCQLIGIPSAAYPTPAKRPAFSLLDTTKIKTVYGLQIPNYLARLQTCIAKIAEEQN